MDTANYHITLVHGTFAKGAPWTNDGSALRQRLVEQIPGHIEFHRFCWSGWPSHLARDQAARRLRANLSEQMGKYPTARHCIIAHSHGGNVACYAARGRAISKHLDCIVALSTPFLVARQRNLSLLGVISVYGSLCLLAIGLILLPMYFWSGVSTGQEYLSLWRRLVEHPYSGQNLVYRLVAALPGLLLIGAGFALARFVQRRYRWLVETLMLPELRSDQLFIVRGPADEANALLVAAEFLEMLVTVFEVTVTS
jgi:hypothetical protein